MNEIWLWITQNFNNREIAAAAWMVLILGFFSMKKDVRNSLFGVIRAVADRTLLIVFVAFAGWIGLLSWVATLTGLWTSNQGVPTVVWYFIGGLPLLFRAFDAKEGTQHFRGYPPETIVLMVEGRSDTRAPPSWQQPKGSGCGRNPSLAAVSG